jgi:MFS family permease
VSDATDTRGVVSAERRAVAGAWRGRITRWRQGGAVRSRSFAHAALPLQPAEISGAALRRAVTLVTAAWVFGSVFVNLTSGAPLTLFATHLGATNFEFGLLTAIPFLTSLLSLPASLLTERLGQRRRIFLWGLYSLRLMWFPLALLPLWMVGHYGLEQRRHAMMLFLLLFTLMNCGQAVGGPAWTSWMADIVPDRLRGRYFSYRRQWGNLSGLPAALLAGWLLDVPSLNGTPMRVMGVCAALFVVGAVCGNIDIAHFHFVPEPPRAPQRGAKLMRSFAAPLKDRKFLWFAAFVGTMTFAISFMGQFVTLYLVEQVKLKNLGTQVVTLAAPMIAQLLVLPVWGMAADRMGKKPLLKIASFGLVPVGLGWCLIKPDMAGGAWLGAALSGLGAALWAGFEVANLNMTLEMSGAQGEGGSAYVAVNSVIINVAGCLGGLAAGFIGMALSDWSWTVPGFKTVTFYDVLFVLSGVLRLLAAAVFLPRLAEPAARPTIHTLRYMTANIYNNLYSAVLMPMRWVVGGRL